METILVAAFNSPLPAGSESLGNGNYHYHITAPVRGISRSYRSENIQLSRNSARAKLPSSIAWLVRQRLLKYFSVPLLRLHTLSSNVVRYSHPACYKRNLVFPYISTTQSHRYADEASRNSHHPPVDRPKFSTMQLNSVLSLLAAASLATAQCNKIQIFTAVGHGETYPGVQRSITTAVCKGVSSCGVANIQYASVKTDNTYNGCKAIEEGIAYGRTAITDYAAKCPEAKIVVTGWSMVSLMPTI